MQGLLQADRPETLEATLRGKLECSAALKRLTDKLRKRRKAREPGYLARKAQKQRAVYWRSRQSSDTQVA